MAMSAQRLPIAAVPKLFLVATVRINVVNDRSRFDSPFRLARSTQRVLGEVRFPSLLPSRVITSLSGVATLLVMLLASLLAVPLASARPDQLAASRCIASPQWCLCHYLTTNVPSTGMVWLSVVEAVTLTVYVPTVVSAGTLNNTAF